MKHDLASIAIFAAIIAACWVLMFNALVLKKVSAPIDAQIQYETFKQSAAYKDGAVQELENMRFEYEKATPEQKPGLAALIRRRAATVPGDSMSPELYSFIHSI